ncbi:MAG: pyridoxal-phosphate dependent enzyme [Bacteroidota bacterium]
MMLPDANIIIENALRIKPYINRTPVLTSQRINTILGADIYFKCENFQKAGAFKSRGAVNAVFLLHDSELNRGVATHSSGNHAAALARAASLRGIKAHIVMPDNSSKVKIDAVRSYGGIITFCIPTLEARETTLHKVIEVTNAIEIHPYNNYNIIWGQATAAKELIEDINDLDIIMAPVGGGGLLSGTALSTHYFSPKTKVIAAEPEQADDAYQSFMQKKFIPSINPDTIADGLRTSLGTLTYPIIQKHVHQIVTVSEESIVNAMRLVWESMKIIIETSSAVTVAALLENKFEHHNTKIGIILSGGNVDLDELPWIKSN